MWMRIEELLGYLQRAAVCVWWKRGRRRGGKLSEWSGSHRLRTHYFPLPTPSGQLKHPLTFTKILQLRTIITTLQMSQLRLRHVKNHSVWGHQVAQSVEHLTGSGHDLGVGEFEPHIWLTAGSLSAQSLPQILFLPLSASPPFVLSQ